jgi:hypothetical protein
MAKKMLVLGKQTVQIEETDHTGGCPRKLLRATVGETTVESTIVFGANSGPQPDVSIEQLQVDLDAARHHVAEEALWRENLRQAVKMLK